MTRPCAYLWERPSEACRLLDAAELRVAGSRPRQRSGTPPWRVATDGALHVFIEHFTGDAPAPVGLSAPDHQETPSYPRSIRASCPAQPARTAQRRREIARPEDRFCDDLRRGHADLRRYLEERAPSLDRRRPRPHEDRIIRVEVHPCRRIGRLESLGKSFLTCPDSRYVGRRKRQLANTVIRMNAIRRRAIAPPCNRTSGCASVQECHLNPDGRCDSTLPIDRLTTSNRWLPYTLDICSL